MREKVLFSDSRFADKAAPLFILLPVWYSIVRHFKVYRVNFVRIFLFQRFNGSAAIALSVAVCINSEKK